MFTERIYNFSAGPSMLPEPVLKRVQGELLNYGGTGIAVMEMSHRSKMYLDIFEGVKARVCEVLDIPEGYHVLFAHGGATAQFSAIPMNLIGEGSADYAITGNFAQLAAAEAKKYGRINIIYDTSDKNHTYIPRQTDLKFTPDASYFHYCANNTIFGTAWDYIPDTGGKPLVSDMSSCILSEPLDVSKFGLIYAGAQKNIAPSALALLILKDGLPVKPITAIPKVLDYNLMIKNDSMLNTPPTFNIYILGLVLDWIKGLGGLTAMREINRAKAAVLYDFLDNSAFYNAPAVKSARSIMNITFRTPNEELDAAFAKESAAAGLANLKGHRLVGGMRASIYNAMPLEGVKKLVEFMGNFERKNS
ncbi:MAG: 3-phosphoserine/phosphohydroxythreonine transaminase [Deferribacteraceae bacterium]|jgi:phosphoserine aminotransferase|nr:3-phosphoserine/phosphohydroxythreonine transaminase [Deferribacteraceae bacterium]